MTETRTHAVRPADPAAARDGCAGIDWKLADTVVIPVQTLPEELGGRSGVHQSGREE